MNRHEILAKISLNDWKIESFKLPFSEVEKLEQENARLTASLAQFHPNHPLLLKTGE